MGPCAFRAVSRSAESALALRALARMTTARMSSSVWAAGDRAGGASGILVPARTHFLQLSHPEARRPEHNRHGAMQSQACLCIVCQCCLRKAAQH